MKRQHLSGQDVDPDFPIPVEEARLVPRIPDVAAEARWTTSYNQVHPDQPPVKINGVAHPWRPIDPTNPRASGLLIGRRLVAMSPGLRVTLRGRRVLVRCHVVNAGDAFRAAVALCQARDILLDFARRALAQSGRYIRALEVRVVGQALSCDIVIEHDAGLEEGLAQRVGHLLAPKIAELTGGKIVVRVVAPCEDFCLAEAHLRLASASLCASRPAMSAADIVQMANQQRADSNRRERMIRYLLDSVGLVLRAHDHKPERIWRAFEMYLAKHGNQEESPGLARWSAHPDGTLTGSIEVPFVVKGLKGNVNDNGALVAASALMASLGYLVELMKSLAPTPTRYAEGSGTTARRKAPPLVATIAAHSVT